MSAAIAGPASAISAAVANTNFRIISPRDERGSMQRAGGGRCSRSATPMRICGKALSKSGLRLGPACVHDKGPTAAAALACVIAHPGLRNRANEITACNAEKDMTTMTSPDRREKIWAVVRVASGNFLEMYDFFVFGYYATAIGKAFFPTGSEFAQLMLA